MKKIICSFVFYISFIFYKDIWKQKIVGAPMYGPYSHVVMTHRQKKSTMLLQVEIMVLFGWKVFGINDNVLQMLLFNILPKKINWIFLFVLQHHTMISDCSLPPLGCNWLNFQKLWKNRQLCPKTSKRKVFWEKICHNWGNPTFLTFKNKTTWVHHATEPTGEKYYYFLYMQLC